MNEYAAAFVEALDRWTWDAVAFVEDNWPGVELEPFQRDALEIISDPNEGRVSIRSGHGVGKSALDAWSVLWFSSTRYPFKVPCTAPTAHQLDDILIAEISQWLKSAIHIQGVFELKKDRLELKAAHKECFAAFRTGSKHNPDALQGFHSDNILFVLDEASGIDDTVFVVAEGALSTPGARVLMTGNPTKRSGYFYDSHHSDRARWRCLKVSCEDSSRVSPDYIESMKRYGVTSNIYRVRVLGEFPLTDDDAVISLEHVEAAIGREVVTTASAPIVWGLDVARFGDDRNALAKRKGNELLGKIEHWRGMDLMQTAGKVKLAYDDAAQKPELILIDSIGLGAGVVDRLNEIGLPVKGINVAESASSKDRYMRLRDELWFAGREWFEAKDCKIIDDPDLIAELSSVSYKIWSGGKIEVQSKAAIKKDGRSSPDLADAFLLTFAGPTRSITIGKRAWSEPLKYNDGWVI